MQTGARGGMDLRLRLKLHNLEAVYVSKGILNFLSPGFVCRRSVFEANRFHIATSLLEIMKLQLQNCKTPIGYFVGQIHNFGMLFT